MVGNPIEVMMISLSRWYCHDHEIYYLGLLATNYVKLVAKAIDGVKLHLIISRKTTELGISCPTGISSYIYQL